MNFCRIGGGFNFMAKYVLDCMKNYSNIKLVCPVEKGLYWIKQLHINEKEFPLLIPDAKYMITTSAIAQPGGKKFTKEIFKLQTIAELRRGQFLNHN